MGSTTPYALRYPEYAAGADPKRDIQYLAEDVAPKLYRAEPLTAAQIAAIASPRVGQLAMNTDTGRVVFWNGTAWRGIGEGASGQLTLTTTATGADTQYSFFVGFGFSEVDWFATVNSSNFGFGALSIASAAGALLRSNYNGGSTTAAGVTVAVADATNVNGSRVSNAQSTNTTNYLYNTYYTPTTGYVYFNLANPIAASQRINWRAR